MGGVVRSDVILIFSRALHIEECHGKFSKDGPNECPHCKKTVIGLKLLKSHIDNSHRDRKLKCKECDLVFRNASDRYRHWAKGKGLQFLSPIY